MSRKLVVEIIGDARSLDRSLNRAGRSAQQFEGRVKGVSRSMGGFARNVIGLGVAFAGFEGLKSSISTVIAAQSSMVKLDQAVRNAHGSVAGLTPVFNAQEAAARKLGFTDDQSRESLAMLTTAFGATKKSLGEVSVATDYARARNMDLADATRQIILLQEGNTRASKVLGLTLPDLAKKTWQMKAAQDGLTIAQEKGKVLYQEMLPRIKAQAAAFAASPAGKIAEFRAQIQHLEEAVGQNLLPTINRYLTRVDDWLSKSANQKRVTDDVRNAVHLVAGVIHDAGAAFDYAWPKARKLVDALGGVKTVLEGLALLRLGTWATALIGSFAAVGGSATVASGEVGALRLGLMRLNGYVAVATVLFIERHKIEAVGKQIVKDLNPDPSGPKGGLIDTLKDDIKHPLHPLHRLTRSIMHPFEFGTTDTSKKAAPKASPKGSRTANVDPKKRPPLDLSGLLNQITGSIGAGLTTAQELVNAYGDGSGGGDKPTFKIPQQLALAAAQAATTATMVDDIKAAKAIKRWTEAAIKSGKLRGQMLIDAYNEIAQQNSVINGQVAASFTVPMKLEIAAAKAGTTAVETDDIRAAKAIKAFAEAAVKSGKLRGQALIDAYNTITQENSIIGGQVNRASGYAKVSTRQLTAGLDLTRAQRLRLESRFAQAEAHGGYKPRGEAALGVVINVNGNGKTDEQLARTVLEHIRRERKRGATQRRGRHGGHNVGAT